MFEPGTVVADKYRIERVIGRGGMGIVVAATHAQLGTSVALKFLTRGHEHKHLIERFLREARATAQLNSEHVCKVFDVGVHGETPFLVMEMLEGTDLSRVLKKQPQLAIADACDYVIQACAGVAEAHRVGIVHRDLKPGNLFLTSRSDGSALVKVLDFGVAKASDQVDTELTQTDTILGSPSYMSLEQLRSSKLVDARSDIWSLGVILFEMIAGRRPYIGEGVADLALKIAMEPTPTPFATPHPLDPVIQRCLAKDPAQRFQSVAELAEALAPFSPDTRTIVPAVSPIARRPTSLPDMTATSETQPSPSAEELIAPTTIHSVGVIENPSINSRRNRNHVFVVLGSALVLGMIVGIIASVGGDDAAPGASTRPASAPVKMEVMPPDPPPAAPASAPPLQPVEQPADQGSAAPADLAANTTGTTKSRSSTKSPTKKSTTTKASTTKPSTMKPSTTKPSTKPTTKKPPVDLGNSRI